MFGYVAANYEELTPQEKIRYNSVYCGICREIRKDGSQLCRLGLSYDMAFLALLHMSLYEPEETSGGRACLLHPAHPKPWVVNDATRYAAAMNLALAYFNCLDDWQDDRNLGAKIMAGGMEKYCRQVQEAYPRQWSAIETGIRELGELERQNCPNPDLPANAFGKIMGEILVWREDLWQDALRQMGFSLGRFLYLTDAAVDYHRDAKRKKYNPYLAMGLGENFPQWEEYMVLAMARCTQFYEQLPLVQDKGLLDNILYSGVWASYRRQRRQNQPKNHHRQEDTQNG